MKKRRATTTRRHPDPGVVIDGRFYSSDEVYRRAMGEEAFARSCALPDPSTLRRRRVPVEQLGLVDADQYRGRKLTAEELYERERRRGHEQDDRRE
jgi:hypothetical protein